MSFASPQPRWLDLYISAGARAVSSCGDMLAATALALILQGRGAGGIAVAAILLAAAVPPVLLAPVVGRVADRVDSRLLLVATGFVQVATCVALAYATSPIMIIGLVAVLAAGLSLTSPTLGALTPEMVGRDNLAKAGGISQTATMVGLLLAPALGGLLVGHFGMRVPLLIDAATYLAVPAAGLAIRTRRGGKAWRAALATAVDEVQPRRAVFRMRGDALLWPLTVLYGAVVAAISAVNVIEVFFVRESLHSTPTMYGVLGAIWMTGMVVGTVWAARRSTDDAGIARGMFVLVTLSSAFIGAAALVPQVGWLVPLWLIGGVFNGGENVFAGVLLGRRVPAAVRGHAGATFSSIMNGANALGFVLGGLLMAATNAPRLLILGSGATGLLAAAIFAAPLLRATALPHISDTPIPNLGGAMSLSRSRATKIVRPGTPTCR